MDKKQFARWKRLSIGLARHGYANATRKRRKKIVDEVKSFIEYIAEFYPWEKITDWDGNGGSEYIGDALSEYLDDHLHYNHRTDKERGNKFANQVSSCVRAGFDVAISPSGGVVGFTLGDLQKIFRHKIPQWVASFVPVDVAIDEALWL